MLKFIPNNPAINKDLTLLLTIGGLYSLGIFLSNTFVNVYLWRQSNDFITIGLYNLAIFVFQPITFIVAGKLAKKIDRIIVLRLGVIFFSFFFLTVLIIGKHAAIFNILLGCLLGIGYGFYWLAFNVLTFEITEPETRDFFNGFMGGLESLGGMVGPLLAGIIISKMSTNIGYMTVFSISLGLFILAVVSSFFLKRRKARGKYELKKVFQRFLPDANWRNVLLANLCQGLREGIFVFIITIWVFIITNSEFAVGIFNLVFCGVSFVFYMIVSKIIYPKIRNRAILMGSIIISLSVYILVFHFSIVTALLYALVIGIAYPIINIPLSSSAYDVIGSSPYAKDLRIEYVVTLELFVNLGRVFSISLFIICLSVFHSFKVIPILLVIVSHAYLLVYYFMNRIPLQMKYH